MILKRSNREKNRIQKVGAALRSFDRQFEMIHKQSAVRQTGQPVMESVVQELLLRPSRSVTS